MTSLPRLLAAVSLLGACNTDDAVLMTDLSLPTPDMAAPSDMAVPFRPRDLSPPPPCVGTLIDYCAGQPCRDYDAEVASERARAAQSFCFLSRLGTCGALRFVEFSLNGSGDRTLLYYDAGGALVAAHIDAGYKAYCSTTSSTADYGPAITCTRAVTETLCCQLGPSPDDGGC